MADSASRAEADVAVADAGLAGLVAALRWAGSMYAERWSGYMDGAVRSGESSAPAVLEPL